MFMVCSICDIGLWCWCLWSVVFILGSVIFVVCSVCDDYVCDLSMFILVVWDVYGLWCLC